MILKSLLPSISDLPRMNIADRLQLREIEDSIQDLLNRSCFNREISSANFEFYQRAMITILISFGARQFKIAADGINDEQHKEQFIQIAREAIDWAGDRNSIKPAVCN